MTKKQEHASAPPADTSSSPESAHQSGIAKGDKHQPASGHDKNTTGSLFRSTSAVSQPDQDQAFTGSGACAFPPATEVDPYEQVFDDMEPSVTFSSSDDGQLSDSTETPEQTEDMSYRETVRSIRSSWAGITSPPLRLIILSLTNPIIPGRARTQGN